MLAKRLAEGGFYILDPYPVAESTVGPFVKQMQSLCIGTCLTRECDRVALTPKPTSAALTVFDQIAIRLLVAFKALSSSQATVLGNRHRETWKAPQMNSVRGQTNSSTHKGVGQELHVGDVLIQIILPLVSDARTHMSHGMVDTLGATIAHCVLRTRL